MRCLSIPLGHIVKGGDYLGGTTLLDFHFRAGLALVSSSVCDESYRARNKSMGIDRYSPYFARFTKLSTRLRLES